MRFSLIAAVCLGFCCATPMAAQDAMTPDDEAIVKSFELAMEGQNVFYQGQYAEAETIFREVLDIQLARTPVSPLSVASSLHNLAAAIAQQGRLVEAEDMAREALALRLNNDAVDNALNSSWVLLASILGDLNQYAEALELQTLAVDRMLNGTDVDQSNLVQQVATLAYLTAQAGYVADGIGILNQLVPMMAEMTPQDQARTLNALGRLSSLAGQPRDAELYYRQAVDLSLQLPESPSWSVRDKATVLGNLASMLRERGRVFEAEGLFLQAKHLLDTAGIVQSDTYATLLDGLGEAYRGMGDLQASYDAQRTSLDIRLAIFPDAHPKLGASFSNLGLTLLQTGDFENAATALEKALSIQTNSGDALRMARAAMNLSGAYGALLRYEDALQVATQAETALTNTLPPDHNEVITAQFNRAWLHLGAAQSDAALHAARAAFQAFADAGWRLSTEATAGGGSFRDQRRQVMALVAALWDETGQAGIEEAFEAVQWAQASKAADVSRRVAARFASGDGDLAERVRARQNLTNLWAATDAQMLSTLSQGGDISGLQADLRATEQQIHALDQDLKDQYPEFSNLALPRPAALKDIQQSLGPNDAVLYPVTTFDETYIFAINADAAVWRRVPMTETELTQAVQALRVSLDPSGPARAAAALDDEPEPVLEFDAAQAHNLYTSLIEPVADVLAQRGRIMIVKESALAGLPLAVLLSEPVTLSTEADFAQAPWLIRDHSFVTMPSVAAIAAREQTNPRQPTVDFVGFGDPVFSGETRVAALRLPGGSSLSDLSPLPGTRREINALQRTLQDTESETFLGADATEEALKSSPNVRDAALIVFATHGLVAGELTGLAEPALAFSAPAIGATEDGLLTASEAAELDLAADWVVLSACNTAAPDGTPGGEGLSGLASAFLYAGARSLIVSHWPVRDDAAPLLTTATVEQSRNGTDRATALQRAMLSLIANDTIPGASHPSVWAPFVLVGAD